ncbi:MAG: 30S ribosomal protein S17 [bacterium]
MKKQEEKTKKESKGKILEGVVVSDKMKDTCNVAVERYVKLPKYGKYVTRTKKYLADDKGNTKKIGDKVTIQECQPLSKRKSFKVIN